MEQVIVKNAQERTGTRTEDITDAGSEDAIEDITEPIDEDIKVYDVP